MGSAEGWIVMPYPVSANRYWRNFNGRMVLSCEATKYKRSVGATYAVEGGKYHHNISVEVAIRLHPKLTKKGLPSKTRIDLDNCLKVVMDALNNVAYRDDSQIVKIVAEIGHPVAGGALSVRVTA
jgi:crossover junction endodeoxyribonuclease RusA